jgi:hypothetical protein
MNSSEFRSYIMSVVMIVISPASNNFVSNYCFVLCIQGTRVEYYLLQTIPDHVSVCIPIASINTKSDTVSDLKLGCLHPVACVRSRWRGFSAYATLIP